jgi:5-methyltetrahydropteroyltriglutamate--homocysteine methyltransferase
MKRSVDRILTTHTGSLPRPADLFETMRAKDEGKPVDRAQLQARVRTAVDEIVQHQVAVGIDVVDDGEVCKPSYVHYIADRLTGFGGVTKSRQPGADRNDFPGFAAREAQTAAPRAPLPACDGPITVKDTSWVERDLGNLKDAVTAHPPTETFVTAVSPGQVPRWLDNSYYPSHEEYVFALAEAMKVEYRAIVEAGFVLQIDCPDLASSRHGQFAGRPLEEFRKYAAMHIEALNYALDGLPEDRLRMHLCWGNYPGPHHLDVELKDVIDLIFTARPSAILYEAANPRHAHEWEVFKTVKLPEGKILVPGVIESCSNYIEHPRLVAQRIVHLARLVGRENVMAGSDCGFGTWGTSVVDPEITWAKLGSLVEGATLASDELWG